MSDKSEEDSKEETEDQLRHFDADNKAKSALSKSEVTFSKSDKLEEVDSAAKSSKDDWGVGG